MAAVFSAVQLPVQGLLVDSDVLIWFTRGHRKAQEIVQSLAHWQISAVSYMELVQGCRNKAELKAVLKALSLASGEVLHLTESISEHACELVEKHGLSHNLQMADALIAATAIGYALPLLKGNVKHFAPIAGLKLEIFRP